MGGGGEGVCGRACGEVHDLMATHFMDPCSSWYHGHITNNSTRYLHRWANQLEQ